MLNMIRKFFQFEERKATFRKEIIGGVVTFLAMSYILVVNPGIASGQWSNNAGIPYGGVFFATAAGAMIATLVMAFLAKLPIGLAPGMGVNAFFIGTIIGVHGYTWQEALALSFIGGLLFLIISFSGLRKKLVDAIPKDLKAAIGAGIGFFIAFVGLRLTGIFVWNDQLALGDLSNPTVLLGLFSILVIIVIFSIKHKISNFAFIISILLTAGVGLILGALGVDNMPAFGEFDYAPLAEIKDVAFVGVFDGFKTVFTSHSILTSAFLIFALLFVDIFDTTGTLVAVAKSANLEDENGNIPNIEKALLADAIGTLISSTLGTPEITSYVESATGTEAGARTGFSSVIVALLFGISIALFPIFNVFTHSAVTAGALFLVGVLMAQQLKEIDWSNATSAIAAFATIAFMVVTGSVADGIAFGFISYTVIKLVKGEYKEVHPILYGSSILFIVYFVLSATVI